MSKVFINRDPQKFLPFMVFDSFVSTLNAKIFVNKVC